jgi:carbon-monoxide dehydrogenase small subunit
MTDSIVVNLTVNGRPEQLSTAPHHTLVDMLRDELRLFGVREGCGVGMCGACTVLLDGKLVSGCLVLAPLAEGSDVVTIEGLETADGELDPMQQSFVDHTAFQCAYCTSGFILSARALLAEQPDAEAADVHDYLGGNLCRCGSYTKITAAVLAARDRSAAI